MILPPPPTEEPDVPHLVEWDPSSALWKQIVETSVDTLRPGAFRDVYESDGTEAIE